MDHGGSNPKQHQYQQQKPASQDVYSWGQTILSFGKYAGCTYSDVKQRDPSYIVWALNQARPSGALQDFVSYLNAASSNVRLNTFAPCSFSSSLESPRDVHHIPESSHGFQLLTRAEEESALPQSQAATRNAATASNAFSQQEQISSRTPVALAAKRSSMSSTASRRSFDPMLNPNDTICETVSCVVLRLASATHFTVLIKTTDSNKLTTYLPSALFSALRSYANHEQPAEASRTALPHVATRGVRIPAKEYHNVQTLLVTEFKIQNIEGIPAFVLIAFENFRPFLTQTQKIHRKSANILTHTLSPRTVDQASQLQLRLGPRLCDALKPFQLEGIKFGLRNNGRCLIGDEMGLGKTLQALGIAAVFANEWPCLIISPSSIRFQWRDQINTWLSHLVNPKQVIAIRSGKDAPIDPQHDRIVICSYDLIKHEKFRLDYKVVICDESHYLKNMTSQRALKILPLLQRARRAVLLSGTPALNKPTELYSQLSAIIPSFATAKEFATRYAETRINPWSQKPEYIGHRLADELYTFLNHTVMVRRLKRDVQTQLPPKIRSKIPVECSAKERQEIRNLLQTRLQTTDIQEDIFEAFVYQTHIAAPFDTENEENTLDEIDAPSRRSIKTNYAQQSLVPQLFLLSGKGKVKAVTEHLQYLLSNSCKFLVFAHHRVVLDELDEFMRSTKTAYIRVDGSVRPAEREARIKQFQTSPLCQAALLSITACSHGFNLTAAGTVVFAELYWVPGVVVQAEDRCHRIGTEHSTVDIHYIIGEDTVDELMWRILEKKWSAITTTLNGEQESYDATTSKGSCNFGLSQQSSTLTTLPKLTGSAPPYSTLSASAKRFSHPEMSSTQNCTQREDHFSPKSWATQFKEGSYGEDSQRTTPKEVDKFFPTQQQNSASSPRYNPPGNSGKRVSLTSFFPVNTKKKSRSILN